MSNENPTEPSSETFCIVRSKPADGAHSCIDCCAIVHYTCGKGLSEENEGFGQRVKCQLCLRSTTIKRDRIDARENLEKQAKKMLLTSEKSTKLLF